MMESEERYVLGERERLCRDFKRIYRRRLKSPGGNGGRTKWGETAGTKVRKDKEMGIRSEWELEQLEVKVVRSGEGER